MTSPRMPSDPVDAATEKKMMRVAGVSSNWLLVTITALVILTEGLPPEPTYKAFTLLALVVPAINVLMTAVGKTRTGPTPPALLVLCALNLVLLALTCWALLQQIPPPEGPGIWAYALVMLTAPTLALAVVFRRRAKPARAAEPTEPTEV